jgi:hypothetical protein
MAFSPPGCVAQVTQLLLFLGTRFELFKPIIMRKYIRNNGLSLVFLLLFIIAMIGQTITGYADYNDELKDLRHVPVSFSKYLVSGHFIEATFENWESEFLQMALFVVLTISLRQKGSSESKKCEGSEEVDREPDPNRKGAPWPVRKGGLMLKIYENSLSIVFVLLFVLSLLLHLYGSFKAENTELAIKGQPTENLGAFLGQPKFWFESFQNWQSEFLSVLCVVVFSIFFRQKGSPQSKPVDASNDETGE